MWTASFSSRCSTSSARSVGVVVHVLALPRLARAAVAAAVMGDDAIAMRGQEKHLVLEGVGAEWPAVAEDDGLPGAPVLEPDRSLVFRDNGPHGASFWETASERSGSRFVQNQDHGYRRSPTTICETLREVVRRFGERELVAKAALDGRTSARLARLDDNRLVEIGRVVNWAR